MHEYHILVSTSTLNHLFIITYATRPYESKATENKISEASLENRNNELEQIFETQKYYTGLSTEEKLNISKMEYEKEVIELVKIRAQRLIEYYKNNFPAGESSVNIDNEIENTFRTRIKEFNHNLQELKEVASDPAGASASQYQEFLSNLRQSFYDQVSGNEAAKSFLDEELPSSEFELNNEGFENNLSELGADSGIS